MTDTMYSQLCFNSKYNFQTKHVFFWVVVVFLPILFLLYIMIRCISNFVLTPNYLSWQYQTLSPSKSPSDCIKLQDDPSTLNTWSTQWKLYFNTSIIYCHKLFKETRTWSIVSTSCAASNYSQVLVPMTLKSFFLVT